MNPAQNLIAEIFKSRTNKETGGCRLAGGASVTGFETEPILMNPDKIVWRECLSELNWTVTVQSGRMGDNAKKKGHLNDAPFKGNGAKLNFLIWEGGFSEERAPLPKTI